MINLIAALVITLVIISLTIYIIKATEPVIRFLNKKLEIYQERKKIQNQKILYERRGGLLLAKGYKVTDPTPLGLYFYKEGYYNITEAELRGWSNKQFKQSIDVLKK